MSVESVNRNASTSKASSRSSGRSDMINLGTGRPSAVFYPWENLTTRATPEENVFDGSVGESMSCSKGDTTYDLARALDYGHAAGSPQLRRFFTEHIELIHDPPYPDWETCLTCSTTSALEMMFRMLCNRGDWILTEEYTYSGVVEAVKPLGLNALGIRMDEAGLLPDDLDSKLRHWDVDDGPKPFVLYTIPCGQNPTGTTQTPERRRAIYHVAEQHDLCIIEDDPYYFLHLGASAREGKDVPATPDEYLSGLPPSYLSLDVSGRVLRVETTSKILAPGLRCGWLTGCSQLIAKFLSHTEFSTVAPSGPSQVMLYKLLGESWGHEGFIRWLSRLSHQYRHRRDIIAEACNDCLPSKLCSWTAPTAGMFLWITLELSKHPDAERESKVLRSEVEDRLYTKSRENGVQISKGSWFAARESSTERVSLRLTFAAAPEVSLRPAVERLGCVVRDEFRL